MTDEQVESLLEEEFWHQCNYCRRYHPLSGTCEWDDEPTHGYDGERCICFDWDDTAVKLLRQEYAMKTQEGKVKNVWTKWILAKTN